MKYFYNKVAKPLILVLTTCALLFTGCKADVEENKQVERNVKIKTINEQGISDETNILPIQQDNILIDVNKTTTQSNVKLLNDTVDVTSDNNVFVDKSATNKGNIVLNDPADRR